MDNLFCISALLFILGGFVFMYYLYPAKDDPDIVDNIFGDMIIADDIEVPLDIVNVPGYLFLFYSPSTRYVYGVYNKQNYKLFDMYTNNGHFCKYLNEKIMEVDGNKVLTLVRYPNLRN